MLVSVVLDGEDRATCEEHLDELALLAQTAGYEVCGRLIQDRGRPEAATLLGRGKVLEAGRLVRAAAASRVILDDDLSPQQAANLEKAWKVPVADRSGLILDIFAERARTREARTQVELASLRYLLPRLTRRWTHLSRQVGGIGVRGGVGETQLELDRRIVRRRIAHLERDLGLIGKRRRTRRKRRRNIYAAALVGYTNSGKSTLFNALTGAHTVVEDRLFATLDPVRRRLAADTHRPTVLTDTVGFIRKLPHHLVASFRSTLEEAGEADLLIQVIDLADHHLEEKMETTGKVLEELDLGEHQQLLVFNKTDLPGAGIARRRLSRQFPEAMFVSARTGEGLAKLQDRIEAWRSRGKTEAVIELDAGNAEDLAVLHRHGEVLQVTEKGERIRVLYRASAAEEGRIQQRLNGRGAHA